MSNDRLNVKIVPNQNSVELNKTENRVVVTDKTKDTSVNVLQKETSVVTIVSKGPKGDSGEAAVIPGSDRQIIFNSSSVLGSNPNFVFNSLGRLGIGTSTPTNTLQVVGGVTATSFTGSFSGSIRAPGSTTQLIFNNNGVLAGTSNITYANNNLLSINTSQTTIGGFTHITNAELASQGSPQLLVGDGTGDASYYAIIPKIYTSKGAATQGQKAFAFRQAAVQGRQVQEFFIETGIIDGQPSTGTESPILTLTEQERVGIGTIDPRAKLEVLGSVLISGSNTLTNIGPAVFSGSISQQPIFTASLGYLTSTGGVINGDVIITGIASINTLQINQTILSTGSNQFGDNINDTQTLYGSIIIPTGSLTISGSLIVSGSISGSLFGTASYSLTAENIDGGFF